MSLSIIPIVQPMYNYYKRLAELQERYGDRIYINGLADSSKDPASLIKYPEQPIAPLQRVKELADSLVDTYLAIYNLRVAIHKRAASEKSLANYYLAIGLVFIILVWGAITFTLVQKFREIKEDSSKFTNKALCINFIFAVSVAMVFLLVIAILAYKRKTTSIQYINQTKFDDTINLFSQGIKITFPSLQAVIGGKPKFMKYRVDKREKGMYKSITSSSSFGRKYFTLFVDETDKDTKGQAIEKYKNFEAPTVGAQEQDKRAVGMSIVMCYVASHRGAEKPIRMTLPNEDLIQFPGVEVDANMLLRDIQQIDIIGQVSRLGDAIDYFKKFIAKSGGGSDSNVAHDKIVTSLKGIFNNRAIFTKQLFPSRDPPEMAIYEEADTPGKCALACVTRKNCTYASFDHASGICTLMDPTNAPIFPLFYARDGDEKNKRFDTYIKSTGDNYISTPGSAATIPNLQNKLNAVGGGSKSGASLDLEKGCMLSMRDGMCSGYDFDAKDGGQIDFAATFPNGQFDKLQDYRNKQSEYFTIRTGNENIVGQQLGLQNGLFEQNRELYADMVLALLEKEDPKNMFVFDNAAIGDIADAAAASYPEVAAEVKSMVTDLLNEIPVRRAKLASAIRKLDFEDPRDSLYLSPNECLDKMRGMSAREFAGNFMTHAYDIFACSQGLEKLHRVYDYKSLDLQRGKVILVLMSVLVLLEGLSFSVYFALKHTIPEWNDVKNTKKRQNEDDNAFEKRLKEKKTEFFMQAGMKWMVILSIIIIIVVVLQVTAQRRERIGLYNMDIMTRNADVLCDDSKELYRSLIEGITKKSVVLTSEDSEDTLRSELENVDIYTIDVFKDNMGLFSDEPPLTINDLDGKMIRDKLANMIEAHEKCNALLFGADIAIPFPVYEISIYVFMLLVVLVCLAILTFKLKPLQNLSKIRYWNRIVANRKRNRIVYKGEEKFLGQEARTNFELDTNFILKTLTLALIPIATLLFTGQLLQSTSDLTTALYGSNLYRNNNCYTL